MIEKTTNLRPIFLYLFSLRMKYDHTSQVIDKLDRLQAGSIGRNKLAQMCQMFAKALGRA